MKSSRRRTISSRDGDMWESAVDIFSLISLVLISAAVTFGAYESSSADARSTVQSFGNVSAERGRSSLPGGTVMVAVQGTEGRTSVMIAIAENTAQEIWNSSSRTDVWTSLESRLPTIKSAQLRIVILRGGIQSAGSETVREFLRVQQWFGLKELDAAILFEG